jgi:DNA polymerase-3 subunit delta
VSIERIRQDLKTGEFAGLYVLYGDEGYLKTFYCNQLTGKIVGSGLESFNLQIFDPDHFNLSQIAAAVNNMPLMSERKCVVLRDLLPDALRAAEWKELEGVLKSAPAECVIIFHLNSAVPDKKAARWKSFLSYAQKNGVVAEIGRQPPRELARWLLKRIGHNGCSIAEEDLRHLVELCGEDMQQLTVESDKICALAFSHEGRITRQDIDALVARPVDSTIYDLARAVTAGHLREALGILDELFYSRVEPVVILSALSGAICDLYRAKTALESGARQQEIEHDFPYRGREFRVRNALRDCAKVTGSALYTQLQLLMQADERIKSSRVDSRIALEQLIIEMTRAGRGIAVDSH